MVRIELFGIPRQRAGVSETSVTAGRLGDALELLGRQFPELGTTCFDGNRLRAGYTANVNGERFVTDPATPLAPGDAVLILSADAGG